MQDVPEVRTRQSRPTTPADLHRLAALAHTRGLTLTESAPGVWFCSSASTDQPHYVTGVSCDCRGFMEHQRCTHVALLLSHLGWLPAVAETPAPVSCVRCGDVGTVEQFSARGGWTVIDAIPCPDCTPIAA
jgi:hypothetical protein